MRQLLPKLLDLLFPPRDPERLIRNCTPEIMFRLFSPTTFGETITLVPYQHDLAKALITENKFYNSKNAQSLLATVVDDWLSRETETTWLVPVPLSTERQKTRGHNQVTSVLRKSKVASSRLLPNALKRTRNTPPQMELDRSQRLTNLTGAFCVNTRYLKDVKNGDTIIIVDDVVTTGATLREAQKTLAPHLPVGVNLKCLAFAH